MLFNTVIKEREKKNRKRIHIGTMDSNLGLKYVYGKFYTSKNFLLQFQDRRILSKKFKKKF